MSINGVFTNFNDILTSLYGLTKFLNVLADYSGYLC